MAEKRIPTSAAPDEPAAKKPRANAPPAPVATAQSQQHPNHQPTPGSLANTVGAVVPETSPNLSGSGKLPADKTETEKEGNWDKFKRGAKDAAQSYKDNISGPLHDFGGSAMDKGGTIATVGAGTTLAGGALTATGIAAPVGVPLAAAGAATTAVGTGVAGVGAATDSAATVLDSAADAIIKGEAPNVVKPALALGARLLEKAVRKIPGADKLLNKAQEVQGKVAQLGGYIEGTGGPCIVGKYSKIKDKCAVGQQAHHIIGDSLNRTSNRPQGAKGIGRIPGMPSLADGPAICLQGHAKVEGSEHNVGHEGDKEIRKLSKRTDNGPVGTVPVSQAVPVLMGAAIAARPECKAQIEAAVRDAYPDHEKDNRSMNGSGRPSTGDAKTHLEDGATADKTTTFKRPPGKK